MELTTLRSSQELLRTPSMVLINVYAEFGLLCLTIGPFVWFNVIKGVFPFVSSKTQLSSSSFRVIRRDTFSITPRDEVCRPCCYYDVHCFQTISLCMLLSIESLRIQRVCKFDPPNTPLISSLSTMLSDTQALPLPLSGAHHVVTPSCGLRQLWYMRYAKTQRVASRRRLDHDVQ